MIPPVESERKKMKLKYAGRILTFAIIIWSRRPNMIANMRNPMIRATTGCRFSLFFPNDVLYTVDPGIHYVNSE